MNRRFCGLAAASPDPDEPDDAHVDLVLDPDKLRIDAYFVQGKSASIVQVKDLDAVSPVNLNRLFVSHTFEVRRRWYNPNKWLPILAFALGQRVGGQLRPLARQMLHSAPRSLTAFAALLAGRKHSASRPEWMAHLAGEPGHQLGRRGQMFAALGFVAAAVRFRIGDLTDLAWMPVDAVLRSRFLSGIFITGPILWVVLAIVHHDGRYGLVLDIQDPFCVGGGTWGTIFGLRKWRKVKPPEHQPRRSRE